LKVATRVPLCIPEIRGHEWRYVKDCLDTGWVSSVGSYVSRFESALARNQGCRYAVATVNGTCALHLALLVAGVQAGDEVLVSTLTFIAPANAVRYAGAWPVLVDAEPNYWQIDPQRVVDFLERGCRGSQGALFNRTTGRRVRALLPVHVLGHPVDMEPILAIARRFGLPVIEDATESLGACYQDSPVGHLGDIACFSFNGNKLITTGGGGMILTDNEAWADRARYLSTQAKDNPVEFVHGEVGYNYRLTNVLAAIGVAQIEQLEDFLASKRRIAQTYHKALRDVPGLTLPREAPWASSAWWMYALLVDEPDFGCSSRELLRQLAERGIETRPLWQPLHLSPPHRDAQVLGGEVAESLHRRSLALPCSVGLSGEQQAYVIDAIKAVSLPARRIPARHTSYQKL
jgi:perosamine synthetase